MWMQLIFNQEREAGILHWKKTINNKSNRVRAEREYRTESCIYIYICIYSCLLSILSFVNLSYKTIIEIWNLYKISWEIDVLTTAVNSKISWRIFNRKVSKLKWSYDTCRKNYFKTCSTISGCHSYRQPICGRDFLRVQNVPTSLYTAFPCPSRIACN